MNARMHGVPSALRCKVPKIQEKKKSTLPNIFLNNLFIFLALQLMTSSVFGSAWLRRDVTLASRFTRARVAQEAIKTIFCQLEAIITTAHAHDASPSAPAAAEGKCVWRHLKLFVRSKLSLMNTTSNMPMPHAPWPVVISRQSSTAFLLCFELLSIP